MTDVTEWPGQPLRLDETVPLEGEGHAWIQWKGTNVCMDVRCRCGAQGHVDDEFAYFYKCAACGRTFAVGQTVRLYPIAEGYDAEVTSDWTTCTVTDPEPRRIVETE